ncbi:MAG: hypothetical protein M3R24_18115 [Chloroflexota bacterium]|nr:hypothetical protein [Chloroflexota bacterium]
MNQGYFLMRGLEKVRAEMSLTVLAYNLKRVLNILGVERLLEVVIQCREDSVLIMTRVRINLLRCRSCRRSRLLLDFSHGLALELTAADVAFFIRGENAYCGEKACRMVLAAAQLERSVRSIFIVRPPNLIRFDTLQLAWCVLPCLSGRYADY